MQNSTKLTFGLTVLAALAIGSLAIECYTCSGVVGEDGGCGQDPFKGHGVTTPNISTGTAFDVCFVSLFKFYLTKTFTNRLFF